VFGFWRPVIAVSPAALSRNDEDLDRIVVHEHAHVQRRDDWAVLLQHVIRSAVGFHPAVWWIDRQISSERESACDDQVVARMGGVKEYAACLVNLAADLGNPGRLSLSPAALSRPQLTKRVTRLLDPGRGRGVDPSTSILTAALAGVGSVAVGLLTIDLVRIMDADRLPRPLRGSVLSRVAPIPLPALPAGAMSLQSPSAGRDGATRSAAGSPTADAVSGDRSTPGPKASRESQRETSIIPRPQEPGGRDPGPLPTSQVLDASLRPIDLSMPLALPRSSDDSAKTEPGPTPWKAAAEAGMAIGAGSRTAAVSTAGFVSKFAKSIAGVF
jgi:BlaR1 peptidase M56